MALPVNFDPAAAIRIYNAVRKVEAGDRDQKPLTFRRVQESPRQPSPFRVCTFTGAWPIDTNKIVTFKNQTSTPNTVNALNLFFPINETAASADCAVAREGTGWYLIDVPFETATISFAASTASGFVAQSTASGFVAQSTATGVSVDSTDVITFASAGSSQNVVTDISISAVLDTNDCSITVSKTLSTASVTFAGATATARVVGATSTSIVVSATASAVIVSSTSTAIFATQTATATVLRFKVT